MAGVAGWSIVAGFFTFVIALIFTVVYYVRYRKLYLIALIASIATYLFSVFYFWDVFNLSRNIILILLLISTAIMFLIGKYISSFDLVPKKNGK